MIGAEIVGQLPITILSVITLMSHFYLSNCMSRQVAEYMPTLLIV